MRKLEKLKEYMRDNKKPFVSDVYGMGIIVTVLVGNELLFVHVSEFDDPSGFFLKVFSGLRLRPGREARKWFNFLNDSFFCGKMCVVSDAGDVALIQFMDFYDYGDYQKVYNRMISAAHIFFDRKLASLCIFDDVFYGPDYIFDICFYPSLLLGEEFSIFEGENHE